MRPPDPARAAWRRTLLAALLSLAACAAPGGLSGPVEANRLAPDFEPTPYSAAEIRGHCGEGAFREFHVRAGGELTIQRFDFSDTTDATTTFHSTSETPSTGETGEHSRTLVAWAELQGHASYPTDATEVSEERVTVPAGTFDCWLYDVEALGTRNRYWFAKTLAGPPVRVEAWSGEQLAMVMELVAYGT